MDGWGEMLLAERDSAPLGHLTKRGEPPPGTPPSARAVPLDSLTPFGQGARRREEDLPHPVHPAHPVCCCTSRSFAVRHLNHTPCPAGSPSCPRCASSDCRPL